MEVVGQALPSEPAAPAKPQRSPLAERAAALLHKRCRIQVQDGRVLVGEFACLDKQGNIILTNTYEVMQLNGRPHEKLMGQVLVPAAHRRTCEFQAAAPEEQGALGRLLQGPWQQQQQQEQPHQQQQQDGGAAS